MRNPWPGVIRRTVGILLLFALIGWMSGYLSWALFIGTLTCLVWHLFRLYQLERWLRDGSYFNFAAENGVWGEIYYRIARLQERNRQHKRKLSSLLNRFKEAAAAMPDATVALSAKDRILWCNEASRYLLGLNWPQDIGQQIDNLVRHPKFVAFMDQCRFSDSVEFPSPVDDTVLLSVRIIPYGQDQRLLLASDISQMQRVEQMRRDFVSNVSHELRSPLTVISGYLETLLDSQDPCTERWKQPLQRMQQQSNRMLHIIEDLLMLSRLETQADRQPHQPVEVASLLAAIAEDARILSGERGHQIRVEADSGLWIRGSEQELRSAFSNLVFNAVRYTPNGGRIIIRWYADQQGIHLEVEDNGEGIAPQHIPRLTERFYRVDRGRHREKGGTGLGLAIVKHVMNRHKGQLRIASQLGVGSTFSCDFPLELRVDKRLASTSKVG